MDTTGWPNMPHKKGPAQVLHAAKVGLDPWTTLDDVGTDGSLSQCYTPEEFAPKEDISSQESAVATVGNALNDLGFTPEWKKSIDNKLVNLAGNVSNLQKSQNASLGMMRIMLQTQGVPNHLIEQQMAAAGFMHPPPQDRSPQNCKAPAPLSSPASSSTAPALARNAVPRDRTKLWWDQTTIFLKEMSMIQSYHGEKTPTQS